MLNAIACELQEARRIIAYTFAPNDLDGALSLVSFCVGFSAWGYGIAFLSGGR